MKKFIVFVCVLILLVGIAYGAKVYFWPSDSDDAQAQTVVVTRADVESTVTAQGSLEPKNYIDVGTQVSGQLKKLHVDIGYIVKQGDVLAEIDPRLYQSQLDADEARMVSLQAQMEQQVAQTALAKAIYDRNSELHETEAVSTETLEQSKAEYDVALAKIKSLEAQILELGYNIDKDKTNLEYTTIYAPMSGTVVDKFSKEGETLNASQTAPTIVQIADLDVMTVRAQVAEADIGRITEDMDVYFTTLGNLDKRWTGKVRQILPTPQIVNDVVLYDVLIDAANPTHELMISMTTQVYFLIQSASDVLSIPLTLLKDKQDDGRYRVMVLPEKKGAEPQERMVTIGVKNRTAAEVTDGLNEGDIIIIPSANMLKKADGGGMHPRMGARL